MSTYMQLIVEVTTGDDLPLDALRRDDTVTIVTREPSQGDRGDKVKAIVHSVAYIPEEALE